MQLLRSKALVDEPGDVKAECVKRNVLHAIAVVVGLERRADRVWRIEKLPVYLEAFRLRVDSRLGLYGK